MLEGFQWIELPKLAAIGLLAGTAGGLIGLGGSIVMVPALTLLLRHDQHLSQAAAMIVNVAIAISASIKHHRNARVRWDIVKRMLPAGIVMMAAGVVLSNQFDGEILKKIFGVFLLYVMIMKVLKIYSERNQEIYKYPRTDAVRVGFVGSMMGLIGGLTGTAGGPVAVPLLQRICHVHLKEAIAASSAVMCVTSAIGAALKNATLGSLTDVDGHPLMVSKSFAIAGLLIPTAILGSLYGATLTHRLPIIWVRIIFAVIVTWTALLMLGLI